MAESPQTILAVDDESDILLIIKTALGSEGYRVLTASDGPEAIAVVKDEIPDLVILDMMMPEMTGFDVAKAMREDPRMLSVPIIMLTGNTDRAKIREALDQGFSYYVTKPFNFHDLTSKVKIALDDAASGAAPGLPPLP